MRTKSWAKILFLVLAAVPCTAQVATNDLFNRPDSPSLGVDWTEQDADAKIVGNKLQGNSPFGFGWCSHNSFFSSYQDVVIRASWSMNGLGGDRISFAAGVDPMTWEGVEVRIADNDGNGWADRIFFNAAINAGAWHTSPSFVDLSNPLVAGEATMWFTNGGDTVNIALRDPATGLQETHTASGILANPPSGGTVGIGYFGNGTVDDFRAWVGNPTQPSFTATALHSNSPTTMLITDAAPNSLVTIAFSTTGNSPWVTPYGIVGLSAPIQFLGSVTADAAGRFEVGFMLGTIVGLPLHLQAFDGTALMVTNYFTVLL